MSAIEDAFVLFLEHGDDMSMRGRATGSMWLGLRPVDEPAQVASRSSQEILKAVVQATNVPMHDLNSHRRQWTCVEARQLAFWFMRHFTNMSLPQIGQVVGGRDHTTIMHGIHKVNMQRKRFANRINKIAHILMVEPPPVDRAA
jgi:chromosomal replication initiation ATPase DnaA